MRSMIAATMMVVIAATGVGAQTPPAAAPVKPKPAGEPPPRPALQTPADTAGAMTPGERLAIQSDLAWVGNYNGAISGEVSERMVAAIKAFQKDRGGKPTGVLNPQERALLGEAARKRQDNVGWKIVTDVPSGARVGLPSKLVPLQSSDQTGARWASTTGTIQIQLTRRSETASTIAKIAEQEKREPAGRRIDYSAIKPEFFVVSGMQGLKKFYVRGQIKDGEARLLTILYDQATEGTMEPVVIAMSSAFVAFPPGAQAAGPPPRKSVEYASGVVVSADGVIVTDRAAVDGCISVVIAGAGLATNGNAERIGQDRAHDLALLRLYGAQGLKPVALGGSGGGPAVDLIGIADPQTQGGGAAVSIAKAQMMSVTNGGDPALSPAPALGFSGAAARDGEGRFAGIALLRPAMVAGTPGAASAQAVLAPATAVRDFLQSSRIAVTEAAAGDVKSSVVRVICVRK